VSGSQRDLVQYRVRRSHEALVEAEAMATIGHWNACASRLYYAAFYAVTALLAHRGLSANKHTRVRSLVHQHFARSGAMPPELARLYNDLYDSRHEGDYVDFVSFEEGQVRPWIAQARAFVARVEGILASGGTPAIGRIAPGDPSKQARARMLLLQPWGWLCLTLPRPLQTPPETKC
jgi:uncharacterized protein (UPF0332 family)